MDKPPPMSAEAVVAALDVGASKVAGALMTSDLEPLFEMELPTRASPEGIADPGFAQTVKIVTSLRDHAENRGWAIRAGGVGVPEYVEGSGRITSRDCVDWQKQPKDHFRELTGFPWIVESDIRCAAKAEARVGVGVGQQSIVFVTVSTGISSCLVINGEPWAGARGSAIGLGMIPAIYGDDSLTLEEFASGLGLARRYNGEAAVQVAGAKDINQLAETDPAALKVLATSGESLGAALAVTAELLDPDLVVLGGSLWEGSVTYREAAYRGFTRAHTRAESAPPIVTGELGSTRGVIGAALVAMDDHTHST